MKKTKEIVARADYELKVIKDKGYAPYFLVVSDSCAMPMMSEY